MTVDQFRQEVTTILETGGWTAAAARAFAEGMDAGAYVEQKMHPALAIDEEMKTWDQEAGHYV